MLLLNKTNKHSATQKIRPALSYKNIESLGKFYERCSIHVIA